MSLDVSALCTIMVRTIWVSLTQSDEGIFLGYSNKSKAYRIFNTRTRVVEESIHDVFCESKSYKSLDDDEENIFKNQFFSKTTLASIENPENVFEADPQNDIESPNSLNLELGN